MAGLIHHDPQKELIAAGLVPVRSVHELGDKLAAPRTVFLYVAAGPVVDEYLDQLAGVLEPGDVVIDGGNSYWGDSKRRHARLKDKGLHFIDLGTSGGFDGARHGACFMVGGEPDPVARVEPLLKRLAVDGGYVYAGPPGAGHYSKLVHNGIEFGMLQAIGEGVDLLEHFPDTLPVADVLRCYRFGSVIRSWLMDLMEAAYREKGGLKDIPSFVEDTGEVDWLVTDAVRMEVSIPVIVQSVLQLFASRDADRNAGRAVAMMRHGFGAHPYGPDAAVAKERHDGRIGSRPGE